MKEALEVLKGEIVDSVLSPVATDIVKGRPSKKSKRDMFLIEHLRKKETDRIKEINKQFKETKRKRSDIDADTIGIKKMKRDIKDNNEENVKRIEATDSVTSELLQFRSMNLKGEYIFKAGMEYWFSSSACG
ncbi:hypothetical protein K501DRAFT_279215 [Backusella circina FSU 941]|nr:hypothetical protein K501DRAFT_279215 [Backusella circina FSU 941]